MKVLWICNMVPGEVRAKISGETGSAYWVDHVLSGVRKRNISLRILCRGGDARGQLDDQCSYVLFPEMLPQQYSAEQEAMFLQELKQFQPDVIHIWGSEYSHTLAMVNAAQTAGMLDRTVISIQGLCSVIARHYSEGIPRQVLQRYTFRDFVRKDNILHQQRKFAMRGELEVQALKKVRHVIGRTDWDEACTKRINPEAAYHFCNETLREEFYNTQWNYQNIQPHRIFASGCSYPVKGFHYLLEAFVEVLKTYPDATLAVPGRSFLQADKLRQSSYQKYLAELAQKYHLEDKIEFLGGLSAEEMKAAFLRANVFVLPSTIENSPNSLGEAMLLGVPCVASDVGGVSTMLTHNEEGFVYQSTAPYMLAHYIDRVFAMEEKAASMGQAASAHALRTHDPKKNLENLLDIYRGLAK